MVGRKKKTKRKIPENIDNVSAKVVKINEDKKDTNLQNNMSYKKLGKKFFNVSCQDLAKSLLGTILVRKVSNGVILKGRIVETECYPGGNDRASYSYMGRKTPTNGPMYKDPGNTFVYMTYGMYFCLNISSQGDGSVVLIRGLEPIENKELMLECRKKKLKHAQKNFKECDISNGPSKLCIAMNIDKSCNDLDLCFDETFWLESDNFKPEVIISSKRIGIALTGEEAVNKLYRFYLLGNQFVSKRDKEEEKKIIANATNT